LDNVFAAHSIDGVVRFAAKKSVGESVAKPLDYMQTNVGGLLNLLAALDAADVWHIVFSSTVTVYGDPDIQPIPAHIRRHTHSQKSQASKF